VTLSCSLRWSLIPLSNRFLVFDGCWLLSSSSGSFATARIGVGGVFEACEVDVELHKWFEVNVNFG
jgi:hypothetical protein